MGSQIGVGKESDIYVVVGPEAKMLCMKVHRSVLYLLPSTISPLNSHYRFKIYLLIIFPWSMVGFGHVLPAYAPIKYGHSSIPSIPIAVVLILGSMSQFQGFGGLVHPARLCTNTVYSYIHMF